MYTHTKLCVWLYKALTSFGLVLNIFLALLRSFFCGVSSLKRERGGGRWRAVGGERGGGKGRGREGEGEGEREKCVCVCVCEIVEWDAHYGQEEGERM